MRVSLAYGGIPPNLIKAIIRRESNFDSQAIRTEGIEFESVGMMQVLVRTAVSVAPFFVEDRRKTRARLLDWRTNIAVGAKLVGADLQRYNGDWQSAVAAYNAGTVYRKDGKFTNSQGDPKVQDYVDDVMRFARLYANDFSGPGFVSFR